MINNLHTKIFVLPLHYQTVSTMSRITKTIANDVAAQLVAGKKAEIEAIQKEQADFITGIYETSLSTLIMDAFKKHKGFIHSGNRIRLSGSGLQVGYKYYKLNKELPMCNSCDVFPLSDFNAAVMLDFEKNEEVKTKAKDALFKNIEAALFNLRTYSNVEKEFPEAFALLPVSQINTSLMVNLKDIRCKLDIANCA